MYIIYNDLDFLYYIGQPYFKIFYLNYIILYILSMTGTIIIVRLLIHNLI